MSIAGTVVGAVGSAASAMGQMNAQKKQQQAVQQWTQEQKQFRDQEKVRQEGLRGEAEAARQKGLQDISAQSQSKRQTDEESRLAAMLSDPRRTPETGAPVSASDQALAAGDPGDGSTFQTDLAKKISEAAAGAKERMGALARVSSYGSSFGGLGTDNPLLQAEAGQGIDKSNEFRRGSLAAFGLEKAIDPLQVTYTPSPLAGAFSSALSLGAQGMGQLGGGGASGAFPGAFVSDPVRKFQGPAKPLGAPYSGGTGYLF